MKDPAFLFYARDFYEGTRTMLPEERACLIDLMIYQHQNNGFIPNDPRRVLLYCSGISQSVLMATLQAKFKLCDKGWYNPKLQQVVQERQEFTGKQSVNGSVGQFFKQAAKSLTETDYLLLKQRIKQLNINNKQLFENYIKQHPSAKAVLEALLKHLANEDAVEDVNKDIVENRSVTKNPGEAILPFASTVFAMQWESWKRYHLAEHHHSYRSTESEQAALMELAVLSASDETTAIAILHQSMGKGWKGLFELKSADGTKSPSGKGTPHYSDAFKRKVAERLRPR